MSGASKMRLARVRTAGQRHNLSRYHNAPLSGPTALLHDLRREVSQPQKEYPASLGNTKREFQPMSLLSARTKKEGWTHCMTFAVMKCNNLPELKWGSLDPCQVARTSILVVGWD